MEQDRPKTGARAVAQRRTLLLWRHAKSEWDDAALADFERVLAPRGLRAAPAMARWIAGKWAPDRAICSPARRTVETWGALASFLPATIPIRFDGRIYMADAAELRALVTATPAETQTLLLIGHNPGLEDLASDLAEPVGRKFATGAVAVLRFKGDWCDLTAGAAKLLAFRRPKDL